MVTSIKGNATSTFGGNVDVPQIITDAPAFSAYINVSQTLSAATWTKLQFNAESFDTNSNYNTSTYRFTPTVAGYYQFNFGFKLNASQTRMILDLYKNGSSTRQSADMNSATYGVDMSALIYMNGTTDYIEAYGYGGTGGNTLADARYSYFDGILVRAA